MTPHFYGHPVRVDDEGAMRYRDDGTVVDLDEPRSCPRCGRHPSGYGGHDPCIAGLPGVRFACCGHGIEEGYVAFEDGTVIRGRFRVESARRARRDRER